MMIKVFLVLCVALIVACGALNLSEYQLKKAEEFHLECIKETGADPAVCLKAKEGVFEDDEKLKEQILCFNKKAKFQDSNGKLLVDNIRDGINQVVKNNDLTNKYMDKCVAEKGTPQETAFEIAKCLYMAAKMKEV